MNTSTTDKKAVRKNVPKPDEPRETADKTPATTNENKKTTDKKAVRVIRTRAELDGGLVISLSMKTDTPVSIHAPVWVRRLRNDRIVDIS